MGHVEILLHWGISKKNNTGTQTNYKTKNKNILSEKTNKTWKSTNYQYYQILSNYTHLKSLIHNQNQKQ